MKIGIDFGTSYTAAAVYAQGRLRMIKFSSAKQFRTVAYFRTEIPSIDDFRMTPQLEQQLQGLLGAYRRRAKADHRAALQRWEAAKREKDQNRRDEALKLNPEPAAPDDEAVRRSALRALRQQWLEDQAVRARAAITDTRGAVLGDAAIDEYIRGGSGFIIQSPKSMLGYDLAASARKTILNVIALVLEEIRRTATAQLRTAVRHAVIGRPVEFRSSLGEAGSKQAIDILKQAALAAGFDEVSFLPEPVAASLVLHRKQAKRVRALIIDIGGGTTDLAYVELGGERAPKVIGSWGLSQGGADVDLVFAQEVFMPLFGRNHRSGAPAHHYVEAMMVHDLAKQRQFLSYDYRNYAPPFNTRLAKLQAAGNTHRTARVVENSKIQLSDAERSLARLSFIAKGLIASANREHLVKAFESLGRRFEEVLERVARDIDAIPDLIYLTGGMSQAPYVIDLVRSRFPNSRHLRGDASLGVVRGLAIHAAN